jgi:hypothetical protein
MSNIKRWLFLYGLFCIQIFMSLLFATVMGKFVIAPFVMLVLHDIPISIRPFSSLELSRLWKVLLILTFWISAILWLQKFIPWYIEQRKNKWK